jgi:glycogen(starch) synthase
MMGRPKILMLGWEFPPVINGGLGVACHDLAAAMSEHADIVMVIPKASPNFRMNKLKLVGANSLDPKKLSYPGPDYRSRLPFKITEVLADLDPYYTELSDPIKGVNSASYFSGYGSYLHRNFDEPFEIESLYGGNIVEKVFHFAEIVSAYSDQVDFDIIHAHDWMTMVAGMMVKEKTGKPLVMHIHSLEVDRGGPESKGWVYELEQAGMEAADIVMPVSNFTAENIRRHYNIDHKKIFVVHNGTRSVRGYRSEKKYPEKTVLFVGRLTRQKGPEKFLEIAARVLEKDPDVRFVMAGVGDFFRKALEESSYIGIGNRFHLTGFLNTQELGYLFSVSDVYCMPSVSEPFGLSAVEAAQFGVPCVISKQSGVSEVLAGALVFDFWDIHKAADYIIRLLHDEVYREQVVTDAYKSLPRITWENSAAKVLHAYEHLHVKV